MLTKFIAQLIYYCIRLLNLTYRYEFLGLDNKQKAQAGHPQKTFAYALWHQNLIGAIFSHIGEHFTMVISDSKDGELVAVTCKKFGHHPARGSSTRGGKKAMIEIVKNMKKGFPGALTVDGPKGPAHIVKPGIIEIARLSHCAILPLSPYAEKYWVFKKSWDQFRIPKPFTKIIVVIGEPIYIGEETTRDHFDDIAKLVGQKIELGEEIAKAQFSKIILK
ncbi:MAG: lysophospholipid acyltransferase family protein [Bacteriovorax sp.]|nr:lysophospholipid acyltransferase family protein [Bacteriovorax sp.]